MTTVISRIARSVVSGVLLLVLLVSISPVRGAGAAGPALQVEQPVLMGRVLGVAAADPFSRSLWARARRALTTEDQVDLQFFVDGERGSEAQVLHDLRRSRAQLTVMPIDKLTGLIPELNVPGAPFLFASADEARFVFDNYLFEVFDDLLATQGLQLLTWQALGFRGLIAGQGLYSPSQVFGMRFFSGQGLAAGRFLTTLGALEMLPQQSRWQHTGQGFLCEVIASEVHLSVPGCEVDSAAHFTATRHSFAMAAVVVNKDWFQSASDDQQAVLRRTFAWQSHVDESSGPVHASDRDSNRAALGHHEVTRHALSEADLLAWREATASVLSALVEQAGGQSIAVLGALQRGKSAYSERPDAAR